MATANRLDADLLAAPLSELLQESRRLTLHGFGRLVSYSRKVFIPLTHLCRDSCHYCTFAQAPRRVQRAYLSPDEVLAIARAGLNARARLNDAGDNESGFLSPLDEVVASGKVPAQRLLDKYNGEWAGDLSRIYEEEF